MLTQKPYLIALGHKRRRGKNTVALAIKTILSKNFGLQDVIIESFASPIRQHILTGVFGLSAEQIEEHKSIPVPDVGFTTRELLQKIGTDFFRKTYGSDIWVKSFERNVLSKSHDAVLIADLRFREEVDLVKKRKGLLIRVDRKIPHSLEDEHISETALDDYNGWDHILNNDGSLDQSALEQIINAFIKGTSSS